MNREKRLSSKNDIEKKKVYLFFSIIFLFLISIFFYVFSFRTRTEIKNLSIFYDNFSGGSMGGFYSGKNLSGYLGTEYSLFSESTIVSYKLYQSMISGDVYLNSGYIEDLNYFIDSFEDYLNENNGYFYFHRKTFEDQLVSLKKLKLYTETYSCLVGSKENLDTLNQLANVTSTLLISIDQLNQRLFDFYKKTSEDKVKFCIQNFVKENERTYEVVNNVKVFVGQKLFEQKESLGKKIEDISICYSNTLESKPTGFEEIFSMDEEYKKYSISSIESVIDTYCKSGDGPNSLENQLEKISNDIEKNNNPDQDVSTISTSQKENDQISEEFNYDEIIEETTKEYIENIENRSEVYKKELEDLLKNNHIDSKQFLENQYQEFYGDESDFTKDRSRSTTEIAPGER